MHPFFEAPRPRLFAHRGASGEAPENTLPAFALGLSQGARYLETDARATRDGEVVLLHDADVERTTDGSGPVAGLSYRELVALDAGHRFTPDAGRSFPYRGRGLRVPRLQDLLRAEPSALVNVEIKGHDPGLVESVIAAVREAGAAARVLLAAAEGRVLERIADLDPGTAIGSSADDVLALIRAALEDRLQGFAPRGHALQVPPDFMGRRLVTSELIAAARAVGLEVHVWTIDEPGEARRLIRMGVDGIMSDFPGRIAAALR